MLGSKVRFAVDLLKFGAVRNLSVKAGDDAKWQSTGLLIGMVALVEVKVESKRKSLQKRLTKA